jgi:hypothetical protein
VHRIFVGFSLLFLFGSFFLLPFSVLKVAFAFYRFWNESGVLYLKQEQEQDLVVCGWGHGVCLKWRKRVRVDERREVMKAYLFAVQWASKPSCLLVGLRTKRPLCSPSSVGEELQASFRSGGLFLLAEQIRSRSALRFRSTCEQGNSRSHAHRLRKIRVYLDAVYFTSRVHVCWLGLLSYVVISKYCRTFVWTFVPHRVRCVSESLDTWFLCWSCLTIHWIPMYVWIHGYMFLCWSCLPIDRVLRHSDLVKSKNTPANRCIGGHRNRTLELRAAAPGQDVVLWKVSRFLALLFLFTDVSVFHSYSVLQTTYCEVLYF